MMLPRRRRLLLLLVIASLVWLTDFRCVAQFLPQEEVGALETITEKLHFEHWNLSRSFCNGGSVVNVTVPGLILSNVTCNCTNNVCHVTNIQLKGQNLTGSLPAEFANLTYLHEIDLSLNYINGSIPKSFAKLPLTILSLLGNRISGSIPKEIGDIATLEDLILEDNWLGGPLPQNLGSLSHLKRLHLSANNFTGIIPATFINLKNLTNFRIDGNALSGKIPDLIGNWTKIVRLDMQSTSMDGPIPSTIAQLKNLTELRISDLNGSSMKSSMKFPNLQELKMLNTLILRNCFITGPIPDYIGELPNLKLLDLSFNMLTGQIPGRLQSSNLNYMLLTSNSLSGAVPDWILNSKNYIDISYNNFTESSLFGCQPSRVNLVSSHSSAASNTIDWCFKEDLPCSNKPKYHSFFINCGGGKITFEGNEYEEDLATEGASYFYPSLQKWAYSSTGVFLGKSDASYRANNSFSLKLTGDYYETARLVPNSLKYYGLCLCKGSYKVLLHFAEIMYSDDQTFSSLGQRIFDVSIQCSPTMDCSIFFKLLCFFLLLVGMSAAVVADDRRTYIIHVDKSAMPSPFPDHHSWYMSTLSSLSSPNGVLPTHLYTYNHVLDGFSAVLSQSQLDQLEKMPGHVATYPETFGELQTTHTPKFLGLEPNVGLWPEANFGDDMIIGVVDTGIWPESESFRDDEMPPVPERWRGSCESGVEFNSSNCNRKLIGARSFSKGMKEAGLNISKTYDYDSPRDFFGHGTHTSSTAAGSPVQDASYFNYAKGTAIGMAPKARLAMYKVIFFNYTYEAAASDTIAGMDQAIADGVDVMSLSLGFNETAFEQNPIAVAAFTAMEKGIIVVCAAGNRGPHGFTILNGAPWITTIGAGTIDRDYAAEVTLGDYGDLTARGKSIFPLDLLVSRVPIYFGHGNRSKEICEDYSLDNKDVAGKYVFCDFSESFGFNTFETDRAGAAGAIFSTDSAMFLYPSDFNNPYVAVIQEVGNSIKDYLIKAKNTTVSIKFQQTVLGTKPAPIVANFSSRGPDRKSPWILKPDILAPGVNILAAYAPNRGIAPIGDDYDYLLSDFALLSGTSMACPHVAGISALLKAVHRDWSPAAIRSALMTTAYVIDNANRTIIDMTTGVAGTPLDYGSGHVDPVKAIDPGLVYDLEAQDYINYLCGMNYTNQQIKIVTKRSNFSCDQASLDLNYPSFMILLNNTNTTSYTFKRVLTSVVNSSSVYRAVVNAPSGMKVVVEPPTIAFDGKYSTAKFSMTVEVDAGVGDVRIQNDSIVNYGYLSWNEVKGKHVVRSPVVAAFAPYPRP